MFTYFSFCLNQNLARSSEGWGYSPAFHRDKLVRDLEHVAFAQRKQQDELKLQVEEMLKEIVNEVVNTNALGESEIENLLGRIWSKPNLPYFGYLAYKLATNKSIECVLENVFKIRSEAAEYRKWFHQIKLNRNILESRLSELDEIEGALREKYKLK